ncbi:hypothetical protein CWATWH0401_268 [Crocosphaera watsonii WH 0401]|uniref:Uncharacterized protein n=1 Tax=Crocosphaera watsonii WH 0401 TaxID=555881 RepID=T2JE41_CROWT|nr:hypothetical protein CWATWH0401_268 [Crocosphaera watsonii WH 0401]
MTSDPADFTSRQESGGAFRTAIHPTLICVFFWKIQRGASGG